MVNVRVCKWDNEQIQVRVRMHGRGEGVRGNYSEKVRV